MPLLDQIRVAKLLQLARDRFNPNLTDAEIKVLRDSVSSVDPTEPAKDAARPEVRTSIPRGCGFGAPLCRTSWTSKSATCCPHFIFIAARSRARST
jgi:hypothetical protein